MSRLILQHGLRSVAVGALAIGLLAGACGGDDDGGGNQELIDTLVLEGATEDQAECFVDELGDDADRLYGANEDDLSEDDVERVLAALQECGAFDE